MASAASAEDPVPPPPAPASASASAPSSASASASASDVAFASVLDSGSDDNMSISDDDHCDGATPSGAGGVMASSASSIPAPHATRGGGVSRDDAPLKRQEKKTAKKKKRKKKRKNNSKHSPAGGTALGRQPLAEPASPSQSLLEQPAKETTQPRLTREEIQERQEANRRRKEENLKRQEAVIRRKQAGAAAEAERLRADAAKHGLTLEDDDDDDDMSISSISGSEDGGNNAEDKHATETSKKPTRSQKNNARKARRRRLKRERKEAKRAERIVAEAQRLEAAQAEAAEAEVYSAAASAAAHAEAAAQRLQAEQRLEAAHAKAEAWAAQRQQQATNEVPVNDDSVQPATTSSQQDETAQQEQGQSSQREPPERQPEPEAQTQPENPQLTALESEILLHETTLQSLHTGLTTLQSQLQAEQSSIVQRKERIASLERRAAGLKAAREESATLVRNVETTLKKTVGRLRKRMEEALSSQNDQTQQPDPKHNQEEVDEDGDQEVLAAAMESMQQNGSKQRSDESEDLHDCPSAPVVPFHQNEDLMRQMWSQGGGSVQPPVVAAADPASSPSDTQDAEKEESSTLVNADNRGDGNPSRNQNSAPVPSVLQFGSQSTAMLPYLLPPIPPGPVLENILMVVGREISASRDELLQGDCDNVDDSIIERIEAFVRGTCLDPLANTGYERLDEDISLKVTNGSHQEVTSDTSIIDPNIALCPYELGGECADPNCPYQHLDATIQSSKRRTGTPSGGYLAAMRVLRDLGSPPSPCLSKDGDSDDRDASNDAPKRKIDDDTSTISELGNKLPTKRRKLESGGQEQLDIEWDGQAELDFVSLPLDDDKNEEENDRLDDGFSNRPNFITDAGACSDGEKDGVSGDDSDIDEGLDPRRADEASDSLSPFWHDSPSSYQRTSKDVILGAIAEKGRGGVRVEDILLLMGFAVEATPQSNINGGDSFEPLVKYVKSSSDPAVATATTIDAIRFCVHSGRYDIAQALLTLTRELVFKWGYGEKTCLASVLDHAEEFLNEAALCHTNSFASNVFNVQASFSLLAQFVRCYFSKHQETESSSEQIEWGDLLNDCYLIKDDAFYQTFSTPLSQLCKLSLRSELNGSQRKEAIWIENLQSELTSLLHDAGLQGKIGSLSIDASTRQLIRCATIGNELASLLINATTPNGDSETALSIHALINVLEPSWSAIKQTQSEVSATTLNRCTVDPVLIGSLLAGPMLFTSISLFFSFAYKDKASRASDSPLSYQRDLDPKSFGTLTTLSNFLNKVTRSLQRSNEGTNGNQRCLGELIAGDLMLAPLVGLCIATSTALGSFGKCKKLMEESLSLSSSETRLHTASRTRSCFIHSELLWSQFFCLWLVCRWVTEKEAAECVNGKTSLTIGSHDSSGTNLLSARRLLEYGVYLRHFPLHGDNIIVEDAAANGNSHCIAIVESIFSVSAAAGDDMSSRSNEEIMLRALTPSRAMTLTALPTSLLLDRHLSTFTFSGYDIKAVPATLGLCFPRLEVLDVSNNALVHLPRSLGEMTHLIELNIESNQLEELPDCIGKLSSLVRLKAASNCIKALPSSLVQCKSLEVLDLRHNDLESVPSILPLKLTNLRSYLLEGNPVHSTVVDKKKILKNEGR